MIVDWVGLVVVGRLLLRQQMTQLA